MSRGYCEWKSTETIKRRIANVQLSLPNTNAICVPEFLPGEALPSFMCDKFLLDVAVKPAEATLKVLKSNEYEKLMLNNAGIQIMCEMTKTVACSPANPPAALPKKCTNNKKATCSKQCPITIDVYTGNGDERKSMKAIGKALGVKEPKVDNYYDWRDNWGQLWPEVFKMGWRNIGKLGGPFVFVKVNQKSEQACTGTCEHGAQTSTTKACQARLSLL